MSDSNAAKKLQKVRTFANDAEQAKHKSDSVAPESSSPDTKHTVAEHTSSAPEQTKKPEPSTVVPKPPSTTAQKPHQESQADKKTDDQASKDKTPKTPIPKKTETKSEAVVSDNPPFHQLKKQDGKKKQDSAVTAAQSEAIAKSAEQVSERPDSILSQEAKKQIDVDDTENATIISDTKHSRKSIWQAIGESTSTWLQDFKNTYITPPKPSYTVTKSERRAGVVTNATTRTGASNVSHEDFAARLRARFAVGDDAESNATDTDSVFLPELPPEQDNTTKKVLTEVQAIPRKSSTNAETKKADTKTTPEQPAHTTSMMSVTHDATTSKQSTTENKIDTKKDKSRNDVSEVQHPDANATSIADDAKDKNVVAPSESKTSDTTPTARVDIPKAPIALESNQIKAATASASTVSDSQTAPTPKSDTKAAATSVPQTKADTTDAQPKSATGSSTAESVPSAKAVTEAPATTSDTTAKPSPTTATPEPSVPMAEAEIMNIEPEERTQPEEATASEIELDDASDSSTEPTDTIYEYDEQEYRPAGDPSTNQLSIKIVGGIVGVVLIGLIAIIVLPQWGSDGEAITVPSVIPDSITEPLPLAQYPDATARFAAITELLEQGSDTRQLIQITPVIQQEGTWQEAQPRTTLNALNLQPPVTLQEVTTNIYVGGFEQSHPFVLLVVSDRSTARGSLLGWESGLSGQLAPLFTSTTGNFRDEVHSGHDLRILYSDNDPVLTYGQFENLVFITTTPATWMNIAEQLR